MIELNPGQEPSPYINWICGFERLSTDKLDKDAGMHCPRMQRGCMRTLSSSLSGARSGLLAILHLIKRGIVGVAHHLILRVECVPEITEKKGVSSQRWLYIYIWCR